MKICRCSQSFVWPDFLQFFQKFSHFSRNILRHRADFILTSHTIMLENLTDIVVGDPAILDFAGVVRKGDAVPIQGFGQFHVRLHILTPP